MADEFMNGFLAGQNDNGNGMFGGDGWWAIILFALIFGYGRGGMGAFGGGGSGVTDGYVLASDFSNIERKIDTVNGGLCDGFYAMNTGMLNGFSGLTNTITTNGFETRMGINSIGSQLASCCCDIREGNTANYTALSRQLSECCCENEKMQLQSKYDAAIMNNGTLQAIDKLGDRIIDYMSTEKMQTLRDENQALRLRASQEAQTNSIINQLRPYPVPAYQSCNPFASLYGLGTGNTGCGCA